MMKMRSQLMALLVGGEALKLVVLYAAHNSTSRKYSTQSAFVLGLEL